MTTVLLIAAAVVIVALGAYAAVARQRQLTAEEDFDGLVMELHDTYCRAGDWPHAGECVSFEGYEAAANPLLSILAKHGGANRADIKP